MASGLSRPQHQERKVALSRAHPVCALSAGLRAGRHRHPRGRRGDPMLCAGQGSQLPGLQPAHSKRSASWLCPGHLLPPDLGPQGCNSPHGLLRVSRVQGPGPVGVQTGQCVWGSHSVAGTRETRMCLGLSPSLSEPGLWANLCIIRLE